MAEQKQDGLDWCLGEPDQPGCLGPSTVIVLFYAVGCIVFGFLVSLVVMQMDRSKAKKRKQSMDQNGANLESKVDEKPRTLEEAAPAAEDVLSKSLAAMEFCKFFQKPGSRVKTG